ncbi:CENPE protein, partial [Polypterus senegalus]
DRVFSAAENTLTVYQQIAHPVVVSALKGYNGTVFAYGQTSSGKTFTMMGDDASYGIIQLAINDIFKCIDQTPQREFLLRISYLEIYNETITDLLCDSRKKKPLEIREDIHFASTAKYMKNEPRVNEVLSEEALLRRYRNQIVDLEKLLDEVSSKTRLHATEKENLTILLQEKEQLQREQEDRIKNLTKMIINSSNFSCQEPPDKALSKLKIIRSECKNLTNENENLRLEIGVIECELKEKDEINTFISLEQSVLKNEIATLKAATDNAESLISQLKAELENKKKQLGQQEEWISELQKPNEMSIKFNEMEKSLLLLQSQLESEKMHYKKMQSDLQKELNQAFAENTKLTCLLDGKVPKDIIEQMEMEKVVFSLRKELEQALSEKVCMQTELAAAASLQDLPEKVEILSEQSIEVQEELRTAQDELKQQRSLVRKLKAQNFEKDEKIASLEEKMLKITAHEDLEKLVKESEEKAVEPVLIREPEKKLDKEIQTSPNSEGCRNATEWEELCAERDVLLQSKARLTEELDKTKSNIHATSTELERLRKTSEEQKLVLLQLEEDYMNMVNTNDCLKKTLEGSLDERDALQTKVEDHIQQLTQVKEELQLVIAERAQLLSEISEISRIPELENLQQQISSLTNEKNNLSKKLDDVHDELSELKKNAEGSHNVSEWNEMCIEQDNLQAKLNLKEELENMTNIASNELESLKLKFEEQKVILLQLKDDYARTVNENDRLQNILEGTVAERDILQSKVDALTLQVKQVADELQLILTERDQLLCQINESSEEPEYEKMQQQISLLTFERNDLCRNLDQVQAELAELIKSTKVNQINDKLELALAERDQLYNKQDKSTKEYEQKLGELMEKCTLITNEKNTIQAQLNDVQESLSDLRKKTEGSCNATEWEELCAERDDLLQSKARLTEELDKAKSNIHATSTELERLRKTSEEQKLVLLQLEEDYMNSVNANDCLQKTLEGSSDKRDALQTKVEDHIQQLTQVKKELQLVIAERDQLLSQIKEILNVPELENLQHQISLLTNEKNNLSKKLDDAQDELSEMKKNAEGSHNVSEWNEMCIERDNLLQAKSNLEEELENTKNIASDELESLKVKFEEQKMIFLQLKDDYAHTVNENDRLQNILQGALAERDVLQSKVDALTLQVNQINDKLELALAERDQLYNKQDKSTKEYEQKLGELMEKCTLITNEKNTIQAQLNDVQESLSDLRKKTEYLHVQDDLRNAKDELRMNEQAQENLKRQFAEKEAELNEKINLAADKLESVLAEKDQLCIKQNKSSKEFEFRIDQLLKQITSLTSERDEVLRRLADMQNEVTELRKSTEEGFEVYSVKIVDHYTEALHFEKKYFEEIKKQYFLSQIMLLNNYSSTTEIFERTLLPELLEKQQMHFKEIKQVLGELDSLFAKVDLEVMHGPQELEAYLSHFNPSESNSLTIKDFFKEQSITEEPNTISRPFASGGGSGIVQSTLVLILKSEKAKLENEVLKLNKKNKHLESAVSSLQEELSKWKVRARRMGENFKKSQLPHTPSPQRKTISEATVLSPHKDIQSTYLHRSGSTQFFDNSKLEGLTEDLQWNQSNPSKVLPKSSASVSISEQQNSSTGERERVM